MNLDYKKLAEIQTEFDKNFDKSVLIDAFETLTEDEKVILLASITNSDYDYEECKELDENKNEKLLKILRDKTFRVYLEKALDMVKKRQIFDHIHKVEKFMLTFKK
ncbi:MAG: hypothetical protein HPY57_14250 [Ignavibacteria bacterium]|nr:hypothetical protein [Ignavibacteria bacterium]